MGLTAVIGIVAIVSLIAFLVLKELVSANSSGSSLRIGKFVNVGIWPLVIVFGVFITIRIAEVLP